MQEKHLHIICLDVPYPVDYGGVFDLFYKIKALYEAGIIIHLHCFEYGRGEQPELNKYCVSVNYYPRKKGWKALSANIPYMVASRANKLLLFNLKKDNYPILMEGIHCTYYLKKKQIDASRCYVRMHNVEFEYYRHLAKTTTSSFKKTYYTIESLLLKRYEASLAKSKALFLPVTEKDSQLFKEKFRYHHIRFLPLFLPVYTTAWQQGIGEYCLYHGNLSVAENEQAAIWLLNHVFNDGIIKFIIAGKNPSASLQALVADRSNISLIANPTQQEMERLLMQAQINVLPSLNSTGIKLKLINALYKGRHCVVNLAGVEGSGLDKLVTISNNPGAMKEAIAYLFQQPVTVYTYNKRIDTLNSIFNNDKNAETLISWIQW